MSSCVLPQVFRASVLWWARSQYLWYRGESQLFGLGPSRAAGLTDKQLQYKKEVLGAHKVVWSPWEVYLAWACGVSCKVSLINDISAEFWKPQRSYLGQEKEEGSRRHTSKTEPQWKEYTWYGCKIERAMVEGAQERRAGWATQGPCPWVWPERGSAVLSQQGVSQCILPEKTCGLYLHRGTSNT